MAEKRNPSTDSGKSDKGTFVISRVFDAPRDLVWKAWTETKLLEQWWGPKGFSVQVIKLDLRPGGIFHYRMRTPQGEDWWGKFVFREVAKPERLVFENSFSDEAGNVFRHPLHASWPLKMLSTVTFAEQAGKTTLTVQWVPISPTEQERKTFEEGHGSMRQGWTGTLDKLEAHLRKA